MKCANAELSNAMRTNIKRGQTSIGKLAFLFFKNNTGSNQKNRINIMGSPENGATIAPVRFANIGKVVNGNPISAKAHKTSKEIK